MHLTGYVKIQGLTVTTQACALTSFDVCAHHGQDQPKQHWPNVLMLVTRRVPMAASSVKVNYFHDVVSHSKGVHGQVPMVQLLEVTG